MFDDHTPSVDRRTPWLTMLLWASAMGTYLLVAIGGVTTLLDGGTACSGWPACGPGLSAIAFDLPVLVAIGHRITALVVGLLLTVTLIGAWHQQNTRLTATMLLATVLYPFQVAIGALTALRETTVYSAIHLALGVGIFALTIFALLWQLERTTANDTASTEMKSLDQQTTSPSVEDAPSPDSQTPAPSTSVRERVSSYYQLMKPRLMWLLCLVAVAAMALAAGSELTLHTTVATVAGGVLAVGASGVFNNILERDVDQQMERTADRPLVEGRIPVYRAVAFGFLLTGLSIGVFVSFINVLSALLAVLAIVFYSIVYTLVLKPNTQQNIVLGGAVGAFPALIGWAAVENTVGLPAIALGGVIFLWTPAHFYNLALAYKEDYARAGFPMLPVVRGEATTRRHILLYLGATLIGSVLLGVTTSLDWLYAITIVLVGGTFLWTVLELFHERSEQAAFRTFHASNAYLGCLLLAIFLDALLV